MKTDTLVIIAAAAVGLYLVARTVKGGSLMGGGAAPTATGAARSSAINAPSLIANTALPGQPGWAWQYFTDGTSIGPDGKYYSGSTEVYDPNGILKLG